MQRILVWDWPVRIGHWLLVAGFALAWLTAESESLHALHIVAGATVLAVASFRLVWGVIGTRYARFSEFVHGPQAIMAYAKRLLMLDPPPLPGHNPLGAIAIVLLLGSGIAASLLGWALELELAGHWLEEVHEAFASIMLTIAIVHVIGIAIDSFLHRKSLVPPMLHGYKEGAPEQGIKSARPLAAIALLAWVVAVCVYLLG